MLTVLATSAPIPNVILDDLASDLTTVSVVIRLAIAAALGALIGLERKMADKPADGRTMMLICSGAAAFTLLGLQIAADAGPEAITRIDSTRVLSYIISGIGFLGAGAILHSKKSVKGLTTAAAIWVAAAIGAACGLAKFDTALMLFAIVIAALWAPWMLHVNRDDDDDDDDDLGPGHRRFTRRHHEPEPPDTDEDPDETSPSRRPARATRTARATSRTRTASPAGRTASRTRTASRPARRPSPRAGCRDHETETGRPVGPPRAESPVVTEPVGRPVSAAGQRLTT